MQRGKTFIFSGPSGVGKSTVLKKVFSLRSDLQFSVSATTRPSRPGEVDGVHYYFVTKEEFKQKLLEDDFLEHTEYCGNYYGTPKKQFFKIACPFFSESSSPPPGPRASTSNPELTSLC